MKILFGTSHPKHVYIFKNVIANLMERGHDVKVIAVEKEITVYLLTQFDMPYVVIGKNQPKICRKLLVLPKWEYITYKIAKEFKPDTFIGRALPHLAHVSAILKKLFIIFEDTEVATALHKITLPFADAIVTPNCYKGDFGKKHIHFDGYFELAYLHPNYFKPNPAILEELNLSKEDKFVILRFVAWQASHDVGQSGFDLETKRRLVKEIEKYAQVFITSEKPLSKEFEKYRITIPPHKIHDLLYYAQMLVGDTQTMTTEAGILGTPAIRCNSFVGENDMGNFIELEKKYDLIYSYRDPDKALSKALELLKTDNLKREWQKKREKLLSEKIDVTKFIVEFIENYPRSFHELVQSHKKK